MQSYKNKGIKVLLLEGIDPSAAEIFSDYGHVEVDSVSTALTGQDLVHKLKDVHVVGIRSRTLLTEDILAQTTKLFAIGCFCIGTDQVDLKQATLRGIPVFNAPHSNTRSVAELAIGFTVMLMRNVFLKSCAAHKGQWLKTAQDAHEVRGKTLGIVGYGHIGSQVSILAEALGMKVYYYDVVRKLPLGNAQSVSSLDELLSLSDVVTLHVPETEQTRNMIDKNHLQMMKKGGYLINASRGSVVDNEALQNSLVDGYIAGAALDVFPEEPKSLDQEFINPLRGNQKVIMTPHIGGSTLEAQHNIGLEVAHKLMHYADRGSTEGAVNFPHLTLSLNQETHRLLHIHHNVPGMMKQINQAIADEDINVMSQYLLTNSDIGYVVLDIEREVSRRLQESLNKIEGTIRIRVLF